MKWYGAVMVITIMVNSDWIVMLMKKASTKSTYQRVIMKLYEVQNQGGTINLWCRSQCSGSFVIGSEHKKPSGVVYCI